MRPWSFQRALVVVGLLVVAAGGARAVAASEACREAAAAAPFPEEPVIQSWNQAMSDFGARPTASPAHRAFVGWLKRRLREVPGLRLRADRFSVDRQLERKASLEVEDAGARLPIPVASPVPYARLTDRHGVRAPLVYVPPGQALASADVAGRIVLRNHVPVGVPYAAVRAVSDYFHDPAATLDPSALYERDYLGYQLLLTDLRDAAAGGAAGLLFVHEFPREQVRAQYEPYEGVFWAVPALYLGSDEGEALKRMLGEGRALTATIVVKGTRRTIGTYNLIATLAGGGPERIVIASHTDGMNAVWDNGPIAMLALVHHFAGLPLECRPRTLELAFNTAHLYLSRHGASRYADELAAHCDTVAFAVALEHLGAREYVGVARPDGPGRTLVPTGFPEFTGLFVSALPALISAATDEVQRHDLERTGVLRFSPGVVSGEGGSFQARGFPTLAMIAGPWSLYNPAFGMDAVDVALLRRQALAVRDVVLDLQDLPRETIAGGAPCVPDVAP